MSDVEQLPRSLDPLPGESLGGFLLRLSYRLSISPLRLAVLTGCPTGRFSAIGWESLFSLDLERFAQVARLTVPEATALTFRPWMGRYPPIGHSWSSSAGQGGTGNWLAMRGIRYCPACLAGDGSTVQRCYGGPWKKYWLLPVAFACPFHRVFLREGCPHGHLFQGALGRRGTLIGGTRETALHPAQCRHGMRAGADDGRPRAGRAWT